MKNKVWVIFWSLHLTVYLGSRSCLSGYEKTRADSHALSFGGLGASPGLIPRWSRPPALGRAP